MKVKAKVLRLVEQRDRKTGSVSDDATEVLNRVEPPSATYLVKRSNKPLFLSRFDSMLCYLHHAAAWQRWGCEAALGRGGPAVCGGRDL